MTQPTSTLLDTTSEWRVWQTLAIIYTAQLNRQIRRRWLLEQTSMKDKPFSERFRPLIFLEPTPILSKPPNPIPDLDLPALRTQVALLRARVEKGKELASEIERRMLQPRIKYPTHFCHTCVEDGEKVEVLLTKCGHRVCRTCLDYGIDGGVYECSICFKPADFVTRSPLRPSPSTSRSRSPARKCSNGGFGKQERKSSSRSVRFCSPIL